MSHPSSTLLAPFQHTVFTPDTIVFFGFPSDSNGDREAQRFTSLCEAKVVSYRELSFDATPLWHYGHCYEIAVNALSDLETIFPVIEQFGELNGLASLDETIIVLRTRQELHELCTMISQAAQK